MHQDPARSTLPLTARDYHAQSKHAFGRYAPGPASLDWEQQPDPFRVYLGCERILLATGDAEPAGPVASARPESAPPSSRSPAFADLAERAGSPPAPLGVAALGELLRLGLGISAWKVWGEARWAVRCNPSSGNLHPVEAYAVLPECDGLAAGLYHYEARDHALGLRLRCDAQAAALLAGALPPDALLLGLSVVPWREAWKYGVRAWRYCQLDLGHAIAALDTAAACLGWRLTPVPGWDAPALSRLLGLDRAGEFEPDEPEHAQALFLIAPACNAALAGPGLAAEALGALLGRLPDLTWAGRANRLDPRHLYRWPQVEAMGAGSGPVEPDPLWSAGLPAHPTPGEAATALDETPSAREVILRRRSARGFDPRLAISADALYRILGACLPRPGSPPWDALAHPARLHCLIFVHRVAGLDPGLYLLVRDPAALPGLRSRLRPEFAWSRPPGCPDGLALFGLIRADARASAGRLACQQRIAADSSLALAMLGDLPADAPQTRYDGLLREAGALGQVLYLESEALGLGASGIGCFFDEPIHELLGVAGGELQSFYMFTLGPGIADPLASDEAAYPGRG